jgi:hypothetical protein
MVELFDLRRANAAARKGWVNTGRRLEDASFDPGGSAGKTGE